MKEMQGKFTNAEDGHYFEAKLRDFDFVVLWDLERKAFLLHIKEFHRRMGDEGDFATVEAFGSQVKGIALAHDYLMNKGTPSPELDTLSELLILDDFMVLLGELEIESFDQFKPCVLEALKEAVQHNIE